jgi:hypothetical protein
MEGEDEGCTINTCNCPQQNHNSSCRNMLLDCHLLVDALNQCLALITAFTRGSHTFCACCPWCCPVLPGEVGCGRPHHRLPHHPLLGVCRVLRVQGALHCLPAYASFSCHSLLLQHERGHVQHVDIMQVLFCCTRTSHSHMHNPLYGPTPPSQICSRRYTAQRPTGFFDGTAWNLVRE